METKGILHDDSQAAHLMSMMSDTLLLLKNDGTCIDMIVKTENNPYINDQLTFLGKNVLDYFPKETLRDLKPAIEHVLNTGEVSSSNYDLPASDKMYYFKCIIQKYDEKHLLCQYRDITKRNKMKKNLQMVNERLTVTEQAAKIGYWTYSTTTKILRYSGYVGILFKENEDIVVTLEKYLKQVFPDDRERFKDLLERNESGLRTFDYRVIKEKIYFVRIKVVNRYRTDTGDWIIDGYMQNIDDIVSRWNELKMITLAINNSKDSIYATKMDGKIIFANRLCLELNEIPADKDATGSYVWEILNNFKDKEMWNDFTESLRANNNTIQYICNQPYPKFNIISSECVSYIIRNEYGEDIIWNHRRDISDQLRHENELKKAKERAEESEQIKSAFISNMSHEIRTPLNAIVGFSAVMSDIDNREERKKYQDIIESNNKRLLTLVNEVLDLSKIESDRFEFVLTTVKINDLCTEIVIIHQLNVETISLNLDLPDEEIYFKTDRNRLIQVISNLITNAIKFTPKGSVTLGCRLETGFVEFFVKDTGIGIAKDKLGNIFDRFVKVDDFAPGTGLGLAICKTIVEKLGGDISVTSEPDKGSVFSFRLPLLSSDFNEKETSYL
ncbi:MAG: hypothetical protein LLF80_04610 [Porphyromonadaceae bacterium]|nr:hypothetical protein [Porphyromonadaceae bacterium]